MPLKYSRIKVIESREMLIRQLYKSFGRVRLWMNLLSMRFTLIISGHIKLSDSTSSQRYKKNLFKTKILANILPQLVVFMKKHFNSSTLIAIVPNENYFYQNIKSVFSERLQELTLNQRFMIEFIFTIESNFTPQEIS